jgi:hypothetical protein
VTLREVTIAEFERRRSRSLRRYGHEADAGSKPD